MYSFVLFINLINRCLSCPPRGRREDLSAPVEGARRRGASGHPPPRPPPRPLGGIHHTQRESLSLFLHPTLSLSLSLSLFLFRPKLRTCQDFFFCLTVRPCSSGRAGRLKGVAVGGNYLPFCPNVNLMIRSLIQQNF